MKLPEHEIQMTTRTFIHGKEKVIDLGRVEEEHPSRPTLRLEIKR